MAAVIMVCSLAKLLHIVFKGLRSDSLTKLGYQYSIPTIVPHLIMTGLHTITCAI